MHGRSPIRGLLLRRGSSQAEADHHGPDPHHHHFHSNITVVLESLTVSDVDVCAPPLPCPSPDPITCAEQQGTYFSCREEALASFKAHFLNVYINNFPTEPKVRPYYIPRSTDYNNRTVYIAYCPAYHNYGFWDTENQDTWIPYSVWDDDTMVDQLMLRNLYLYPHTQQTVDAQPVP